MGVAVKVSSLDIWALAITISAQSLSIWQEGYIAGFGSYTIITIIVGMAYICLVTCLGEMMSALPFAGGAYGLARCTLGFTTGFLVGICEIIEYIIYSASAMASMTTLIIDAQPALASFDPLLWAIFYALFLAIYIKGGQWFWRANMIISISCFAMTLIWLFGSVKYLDFSANLNSTTTFVGGGHNFFKAFPAATGLFLGVEAVSTAGDDVLNPRQIIPKGQRWGIYTLFLTGVLSGVFCGGLPPGILDIPSVTSTTNTGYMAMFGINEDTAVLLAIPGSFSTAFGFMYAYTKLLVAISKSRLIPPIFQKEIGENRVPVVSLVFGAAIAYCICLIVFYYPDVSNFIFNTCVLSAMSAYTTQCYGYIYLRRNFKNLDRQYHSPFGIPGAIFAMVVWVTVVISVLAFQDDNGVAFGVFIIIEAISLVYYHIYGKHHQSFSEEEKVLFITHVAKFNAAKKNRGSKVSSLSSKRGISLKMFKSSKTSLKKIYVVGRSGPSNASATTTTTKVLASTTD